MKWIKKYFRKQLHISFVEWYTLKLRMEIFQDAIQEGDISPVKVVLFKKYNRYLRLIKF